MKGICGGTRAGGSAASTTPPTSAGCSTARESSRRASRNARRARYRSASSFPERDLLVAAAALERDAVLGDGQRDRLREVLVEQVLGLGLHGVRAIDGQDLGGGRDVEEVIDVALLGVEARLGAVAVGLVARARVVAHGIHLDHIVGLADDGDPQRRAAGAP